MQQRPVRVVLLQGLVVLVLLGLQALRARQEKLGRRVKLVLLEVLVLLGQAEQLGLQVQRARQEKLVKLGLQALQARQEKLVLLELLVRLVLLV
jgi:hypothetical protein